MLSKRLSILIIEDDVKLNDQLHKLLNNAGFSSHQAFNGKSGLNILKRDEVDLLLLDVMLPDTDGHLLLQQIREISALPVILVTAQDAEHKRILGFENGADDYLAKPFNFLELKLRIDAILRRYYATSPGLKDSGQLVHGPLTLDKIQQSVRYADTEITLTQVQFSLLWTLVAHRQQTLSKPMLYRMVLNRDFSRHDRSLDMHMSRVRRKLQAAGMPSYQLLTVHGNGYCLQ